MLGSRCVLLDMPKHKCEEVANGISHGDAKQMLYPEPETPQNEGSRARTRASDISTARGKLMHLSKSADGKLRWLPPSSSTTSSSLSEELACSGDSCIGSKAVDEDADISSPHKLILESSKRGKTDLLCYEEPEISEIPEPATSTMTSSCCQYGDVSESFGIIQDDSLSLCPQVSSTVSEASHISVSSSIKESGLRRNERLPASVRHGLTPYLSSKLKPGKHILGVRKNQVFIRPGQLRHWAVTGNSPAIPPSNVNMCQTSPSTTKGKACRTLNF